MSYPMNECWDSVTSPRGVLITPRVPGPVFLSEDDLDALLVAVVRERLAAASSHLESPPTVDAVPESVPFHGDRGTELVEVTFSVNESCYVRAEGDTQDCAIAWAIRDRLPGARVEVYFERIHINLCPYDTPGIVQDWLIEDRKSGWQLSRPPFSFTLEVAADVARRVVRSEAA